jgi:hypothetical protein
MLKHFTWQQFLGAALILSFIWYAIIILSCYRRQIQDYLKDKYKGNSPLEPLRHAWDDEFEDDLLADEDDLMGKSALPEGMTRLSMAQFGFAPPVSETPVKQDVKKRGEENDFEKKTTVDSKERQQSLIPDVLEELKSIFHLLEMEQGTKPDFISLFALVSTKYPRIKGTSNEQALNDYIRENLPFSITDEELDSLWA